MKKIITILLALLVLVGCGSSKDTGDMYKIGVLQLADHPSLDATYEGMKETLDELLGKDKYEIDFKNAQGKHENINMMSQKFVDDKVDLIYAIATNAAQGAYGVSEGSGIPVVFNAVTDPVSAGLVKSMDKSGTYAVGVSDVAPIDKQIALIKEVQPDAKNIGILYNTGEPNSAVQVRIAEEEAAKIGLTIIKQGISDRSEIALASSSLLEKVDAVYNITDNMIVEAAAQVIEAANKANKPVYAAEDGQFDLGILATESIDYKNLGNLAGILIKEILVDGKKPEDLNVRTVTETVLYINESVAEKLNISLPTTVTDRATSRK